MNLDFQPIDDPISKGITCDGCNSKPVIVQRAEGSMDRVHFYCFQCLEKMILAHHKTKESTFKAQVTSPKKSIIMVFHDLDELRSALGLSDEYTITGAFYNSLSGVLEVSCDGPGLWPSYGGEELLRCTWSAIKQSMSKIKLYKE